MNFEKLKAEVDALLNKSTEAPAADAGTKMTAEQFAAYAGEQVTKAQAEAAAGKQDLAKSRIEALSAEVEKVSKFAFAPGELPAVSVFKDPAQTTHQEISAPSGETSPGAQSWIAKSAEFSAFLTQAIDALAEKPKTEPAVEAPATNSDNVWPSDLASVASGESFDF